MNFVQCLLMQGFSTLLGNNILLVVVLSVGADGLLGVQTLQLSDGETEMISSGIHSQQQ